MCMEKIINYDLKKYFKQIYDKMLYYLLHNTSRLGIITGGIPESLATETFMSRHVVDSTEYLRV